MSRTEQLIIETEEKKEGKDEKHEVKTLLDVIDKEYHFAFTLENKAAAAESIRIYEANDQKGYLQYLTPRTASEKISLLLHLFNKQCRFEQFIAFFTLLTKVGSNDAKSIATTLIESQKIQNNYFRDSYFGIFHRLFLFKSPSKEFSGTQHIIKLLQESGQVKNILKFLQQDDLLHPDEFLELLQQFTLDYSSPEVPLPALEWKTYKNHPLKFTPACNSRDILALMPENYISAWLKILLSREKQYPTKDKHPAYFTEQELENIRQNYRDSGYEAWFFEIIRNFTAIDLDAILPFYPAVSKIVADYFEEVNPQVAYDQLLLECHANRSLLFLIFKHYDYPVYHVDHPFSKILSNLSVSELKKKAQEIQFTKLMLRQENLFAHIQAYFQTKNLDLAHIYIGESPDAQQMVSLDQKTFQPQTLPTPVSCATLLNILASTNLLSEVDDERFYAILTDLRKHALVSDQLIDEKSIQSIKDNAIIYFLLKRSKDSTKDVLLKNMFIALFLCLTKQKIKRFLKICDVRNTPSIILIAILRSSKSLDPIVRISLLDTIFIRLSNQRITRKLAAIPLTEIYDLFTLYPPKICSGRTSLIQQLDNYILRARKKNPLRIIQAIDAKLVIAYGSIPQNNIILVNLIQEIQKDHDTNRYRLLGTSSRLVKILLHAKNTLSPPNHRLSLCHKTQTLFTTTNTRALKLLADNKNNNSTALQCRS